MKRPAETTWIDLANRALARINMNLIKSFDEGTNSSLQAELCLSGATSEILNSNDWKSATVRVKLIPQSRQTVDGEYIYPFPTDFVRLVSVGLKPETWKREGRAIVAPTLEEIVVKYVAFPSTPGTLDPLLQSAISALTAYKMSLFLTADLNLQQQLYAESNVALTAARVNETQGEPDLVYETKDWKEEY